MFGGNKVEKVEKLVAKKNVKGLSALLTSKDPAVLEAAVRGLGQCDGDDAYNGIVPFVRNANPALRIAAVEAMVAIQRGRVHIDHQIAKETDPKVLEVLRGAQTKLKDRN